jgi:hypothetical protein
MDVNGQLHAPAALQKSLQYPRAAVAVQRPRHMRARWSHAIEEVMYVRSEVHGPPTVFRWASECSAAEGSPMEC